MKCVIPKKYGLIALMRSRRKYRIFTVAVTIGWIAYEISYNWIASISATIVVSVILSLDALYQFHPIIINSDVIKIGHGIEIDMNTVHHIELKNSIMLSPRMIIYTRSQSNIGICNRKVEYSLIDFAKKDIDRLREILAAFGILRNSRT